MNAIDRHVGSRLRLRRMELRLSRRDLATVLRVTVERIRRFETGEERIGASLLWQVAEKLAVSIHYFFAGIVSDPDDDDGEDEIAAERRLAARRLGRGALARDTRRTP